MKKVQPNQNPNKSDQTHFWIRIGRIVLVIITTIGLLIINLPRPAYTQAEIANLSIKTSELPALTCADLRISVSIEDVVDLYAYSLKLNFVPGSLKVVNVSNGGFLEAPDQEEFFEPNNAWDNNTGEITFGMTQVRPAEKKSGSGDLVFIDLRAIYPNQQVDFTINLESILVNWPDVLSIPYTSSGTSIFTASCPPADIDLDNRSIEEKLPAGSLVGNLSTSDPDLHDSHIYSLVDNQNYPDNLFFQIFGDRLLSRQVFDFFIDQ